MRNKMLDRLCAWCEGRFSTKEKSQRFCSPRCGALSFHHGRAAGIEPRVCAYCEVFFLPKRPEQNTCCGDCAGILATERELDQRAEEIWRRVASQSEREHRHSCC
jgi:predicted nucleic acid-binding Zn ribbon protein